MSEDEIRNMLQLALKNCLVEDQVISGTLSEMGLDSLDLFEFIIDVEGDLEDNGFKVQFEKEITLNMTIDEIVTVIHKKL
jgi:acyl carrier protein